MGLNWNLLTTMFTIFIHRQWTGCKAQGPSCVRKVQKADREKMRRDKLNEQFQELGNTIGMMQFAVLSIKIG